MKILLEDENNEGNLSAKAGQEGSEVPPSGHLSGQASVQASVQASGQLSEDPAKQNQISLKDIKTVLVVDDELLIRRLVSRQFTNLGYKVLTAENGQEALEIMDSENCDIVLMDKNMSTTNSKIRDVKNCGLEAAKAIRSGDFFKRFKHHKYVPIFCISTDDSEETRKEIFNSGMDDFLGKPVNMNKFLKFFGN